MCVCVHTHGSKDRRKGLNAILKVKDCGILEHGRRKWPNYLGKILKVESTLLIFRQRYERKGEVDLISKVLV